MLALHVNQDYHTTIIIISFCLVSRLALCLFLFLLHQSSSASPYSFSSPCLCLASHSRFLSSTIHAGVYYWRKTQGCLESRLLSQLPYLLVISIMGHLLFLWWQLQVFFFILKSLQCHYVPIVQVWPVCYFTA